MGKNRVLAGPGFRFFTGGLGGPGFRFFTGVGAGLEGPAFRILTGVSKGQGSGFSLVWSVVRGRVGENSSPRRTRVQVFHGRARGARVQVFHWRRGPRVQDFSGFFRAGSGDQGSGFSLASGPQGSGFSPVKARGSVFHGPQGSGFSLASGVQGSGFSLGWRRGPRVQVFHCHTLCGQNLLQSPPPCFQKQNTRRR